MKWNNASEVMCFLSLLHSHYMVFTYAYVQCSYLWIFSFFGPINRYEMNKRFQISLECSSRMWWCACSLAIFYYFLSITNGISFIMIAHLIPFFIFLVQSLYLFLQKCISRWTNERNILHAYWIFLLFPNRFALLSWRLRYSSCVFFDCG